MNIALWVLQVLLGLMFLMAGGMKASRTKQQLLESGGENMAWVESVSAGNVRIIGILEVLIAFGLILPHLTGILPWLTPLAALGLVCTMIGAALLHAKRGDGTASIATTLVLGALALFVAYGRFFLLPA